MGYEFYMDKMLLPVTPSKLEIKIKNKNKTYDLINETEINVLKSAGLSEISFEATFPNVKYPYAVYKSGFLTANYFLNQLELLKTNKQPFQFIVTRLFPNGKSLFNTNIKVTLEDYTIKEDVKQGLDTVVTIKLKQYKDYGTKVCKVTIKQEKQVAKPQPVAKPVETRPASPTAPAFDVLTAVKKTIRGDYGNGQARKNALGSHYSEVQRQVNLNYSHGTTRWDNIRLY